MNARQLSLIFLASFLSAGTTHSAEIVEEWVARYDGPYTYIDTPHAIAVDSTGNSYVTGTSYTDNYLGYDFATIKYNPTGEEQWSVRYGGLEDGTDIGYDIVLNIDGKVCVTGRSAGEGTSSDFITICYDDAGDTEWSTAYSGPMTGINYGVSIASCQSGLVYATGVASTQTVYDYATICYDSDGQQQWVTLYDGTGGGVDEAVKLALDADGNALVTGYSSNGENMDYTTVKYNPDGEQVWVSRYNGSANGLDAPGDMTVDPEGNIYVTGGSHGMDMRYDIATVMYNSCGEEQWVSRYNGPGDYMDFGEGIAVDGDGNVVITGYTTGIDGSNDCVTIMYDSLGEERWTAVYSGPNASWDEGKAVVLDDAGNVYIAAYSDSDYFTFKYDHDGNELWAISYNGPGNSTDEAMDIAIDSTGHVYVTGDSRGSGGSHGDEDYCTIRYSQTNGCDPSSTTGNADSISLLIFPNPSNGQIEIMCDLSQSSSGTDICIYDMTGRTVIQSISTEYDDGCHYTYSGCFPSGIYLCRLASGNRSVTRRFVVIE